MVISIWGMLLIVVVLLALSGAGGGYYSGGAYANPLAGFGVVLLLILMFWVLFGGTGFWINAPPP